MATRQPPEAQAFTLENDQVRFVVTNYGARWINALVPGIDGRTVDILQGYDTLEEYLKYTNFYGTICGRVGNRIDGAAFSLEGETYHLPENVPGATLHGGPGGFHTKMWEILEHTDLKVVFQYVSPDGEQGFPGEVTARATYSLAGPQSLRLDLEATSDQATPVNLAHHPYYNLAGHDYGHLRHHFFRINADFFYPMDEFFTIDEYKSAVKKSIFDLRKYRKIFPYLNDDHPQIQLAGGYDHNFELMNYRRGHLREAARIWEEESGRMMTIHTTLPGIQFYTCNGPGRHPGKEGAHYPKWGSFCLEPQYFPNSPNVASFPDSIVHPGKPMKDSIVYKFDQREKL